MKRQGRAAALYTPSTFLQRRAHCSLRRKSCPSASALHASLRRFPIGAENPSSLSSVPLRRGWYNFNLYKQQTKDFILKQKKSERLYSYTYTYTSYSRDRSRNIKNRPRVSRFFAFPAYYTEKRENSG